MKELQRHIDAFEIYFKKKQEGNDTAKAISLSSLECGFSETSLYTWKKEFDWDGREAIRAAEINKKVEEKTDSTIIENKTKYLSFYHKLLDDLKNDFNIEIENIRDLDTVIKGALNLQGEAGETINHEHSINHKEKIERLKRIEENGSNLPITPTPKPD